MRLFAVKAMRANITFTNKQLEPGALWTEFFFFCFGSRFLHLGLLLPCLYARHRPEVGFFIKKSMFHVCQILNMYCPFCLQTSLGVSWGCGLGEGLSCKAPTCDAAAAFCLLGMVHQTVPAVLHNRIFARPRASAARCRGPVSCGPHPASCIPRPASRVPR